MWQSRAPSTAEVTAEDYVSAGETLLIFVVVTSLNNADSHSSNPTKVLVRPESRLPFQQTQQHP